MNVELFLNHIELMIWRRLWAQEPENAVGCPWCGGVQLQLKEWYTSDLKYRCRECDQGCFQEAPY